MIRILRKEESLSKIIKFKRLMQSESSSQARRGRATDQLIASFL